MILLTFPFVEADGKGLIVSQHLFLPSFPTAYRRQI